MNNLTDKKLLNSWNSFNRRKILKAKKLKVKYSAGGDDNLLSFDQYISWKKESTKDKLNRINTRLNIAILKLHQILGDEIYTKLKICKKCNKKKTLICFCIKWKPRVKVKNVCRDCESERISICLKNKSH